MVKVILLFGNPADVDSFDQHFERAFLPILPQIPQIQGFQVNSVVGAIVGESPFRKIAELQFLSEEAMQEGLNSDQGQVMARDFANYASGGVTILLCHSILGDS